ncbi:pentatricopeptide repeat-containing protein, putative [Ricinus communis]|uniref:Pentatricopeptide repeat-containing protein, putative n=1 Tax=Ricinus communis TaxID=3988 RepID=B9SIK4_RICCO|nr:pentatricopeptide repeat-containing protein, putative [Ricinus communis]
MEPDAAVWGALLKSCKIHGNIEFGELALNKLIELEPDDAGNYVILSNIYAQAGKWDGVAKMRKMMTDRGIKGNYTSYPNYEEIYAELKRFEERREDAGYVPNTHVSSP